MPVQPVVVTDEVCSELQLDVLSADVLYDDAKTLHHSGLISCSALALGPGLALSDNANVSHYTIDTDIASVAIDSTKGYANCRVAFE